MSSSEEKKPSKAAFHLEDFDFQEWKTLYQNDPDAFESKRQQWIDSLINSAPEEYQRRLKGLMFQVETTRLRSKNPVQSCLNISKMMWTSTADLRCFLEELACQLKNPKALEERKKRSADILDFCQ